MSRSPHKSSVWNNSSCVNNSIPEDKLKIVIRIRPVLNEEEETEFVELEDTNTLQIKKPGNFTYMKFNNILSNYSTQKDVFNELEESIQQFLSGTNITIFAYGQTGAGKTYSIIGNYSILDNEENIYHLLSSEERGILSRSLQMIMAALESNSDGARVFISFYEIYNDKIYDLYNSNGKDGSGTGSMVPLDIRESKNGEISIPNLITIEVKQIQEAIHYLMIGLKNRSIGSTHANAQSSRSHSIFQIGVQRQGQLCSLRIVDLAGSEKFKIPSDISPVEKQIRIQELTSINSSLSCLGHCISALIEKSRTHIPFRNSKLTRILSDSLLGQGKMRFIICISPSVSASAETFSTLQFANRAKRAIFERTDLKTPQMSKKKTSDLEEMQLLRRDFEKERELRTRAEEELSDVKKESIFYRLENQKLNQKLKQLQGRINEQDRALKDRNRQENQNSYCQNMDSVGSVNQKESENLKMQMLNLPIFQKQKRQELRKSEKQLNAPSSSFGVAGKSSKGLHSSHIHNKKKAEFEKKIKKFIEQNSPYESNDQRGLSENDDHKKFIAQNHEQFDSLMHYQEEGTEQFFEKACEKLHMKQYEALKEEMEKAKSELLRFKQIDDNLELKKSAIR